MSERITPSTRNAAKLPLSATELADVERALHRMGLLRPTHDAATRTREISAALHALGGKLGWSDRITAEADFHRIIDYLLGRFCSVPDTPRATSGTRPLAYGTPLGRWTRGSLRISVNAAGCNLSPGTVTNAVMQAYGQYQAVQPFFSFTNVPANGDIQVQFGGTNLDPTLGVAGGAKGVGQAPPNGNLYLASNVVWAAPGAPAPAGSTLLLALLLHEGGHTLGLSHSTSATSVMYPFAPGVNALDAETIEAIQSLYGWTPQTPLSDRASTDGPSLALVTTPYSLGMSSLAILCMAWTGTKGDSGLYFATSSDGTAWSAQQKIDGVGSSNSPALASFHPRGTNAMGLFMAWKGTGSDHNIYWSVNTDLTSWSPQQSIPVGTSARPALCEFNGQMVLAWKGVPGDSGIYWSKFDGFNTWSPQQQIAGRGTSSAPCMVVFGGQLHMFWKGIDGDDNVYHAVLIDPVNGIWGPQSVVSYVDGGNLASGQTPVPIGTSSGPSATVRGNELILAWKGVPGDHALWFSRYDGTSFSGQMSVPNVGSEEGPGIANLNGRLVMTWRGIGGDRDLYVSTLG